MTKRKNPEDLAYYTTHGHTKGKFSPEYYSWTCMLQRCTNPNVRAWKYYGGRGVSVCDQWKSFEAFLADMGSRPEGCSLDRIDNSGNYEPNNCRWGTAKEQSINRRKPTAGRAQDILCCIMLGYKFARDISTLLDIHEECVKKELRKLKNAPFLRFTKEPYKSPNGRAMAVYYI